MLRTYLIPISSVVVQSIYLFIHLSRGKKLSQKHFDEDKKLLKGLK